MNKKFLLLGLVLVLAFAYNLYHHSDYRTEKILTSQKWHSSSVVHLSPKKIKRQALGMKGVVKFDYENNIKYLTNNTYIRESYIKLYKENTSDIVKINIADLGTWTTKDGYVFIEPDEYIDISTSENKGIDKDELMVFKKLFEEESKQIRHLDRINRKTILLTGIDNSSRVMFAH